MIAKINSLAFNGTEASLIEVEVHISSGLPSFTIVGLAQKSISESKERIRASFSSIGINLPAKKITVNLSPANTIKDGTHYDLPIAIGILCAMGEINYQELDKYLLLGELSLNGDIKNVRGLVAASIFCIKNSLNIIFPKNQVNEIAWITRIDLIAISDLVEAIEHINGKRNYKHKEIKQIKMQKNSNFQDLAYIKGQFIAKRAIEVAAAGGHHVMMIGPPGSGKSMLANALVGLLPSLTNKEILEVNSIYSIYNQLPDNKLITQRPFRKPHQNSSLNAIIGGGKHAYPGEITLAHNGVLFLDEFPEFNKNIIDALRQPIEDKNILISRVNSKVTYPCNFQLIVALNPCKCGYFNTKNECSRTPLCSEQYLNKISGPIVDRFDISLYIDSVEINDLVGMKKPESSFDVANRVKRARKIQINRFKKLNINIKTNAEASNKVVEDTFKMNKDAKDILYRIIKKGHSARGYYRIIKVAQTIADLEGSNIIKPIHITEATSYRNQFYKRVN